MYFLLLLFALLFSVNGWKYGVTGPSLSFFKQKNRVTEKFTPNSIRHLTTPISNTPVHTNTNPRFKLSSEMVPTRLYMMRSHVTSAASSPLPPRWREQANTAALVVGNNIPKPTIQHPSLAPIASSLPSKQDKPLIDACYDVINCQDPDRIHSLVDILIQQLLNYPLTSYGTITLCKTISALKNNKSIHLQLALLHAFASKISMSLDTMGIFPMQYFCYVMFPSKYNPNQPSTDPKAHQHFIDAVIMNLQHYKDSHGLNAEDIKFALRSLSTFVYRRDTFANIIVEIMSWSNCKLNPLQTICCLQNLIYLKRGSYTLKNLANALVPKVSHLMTNEDFSDVYHRENLQISTSLIAEACEGLFYLDTQQESTKALAKTVLTILKYNSQNSFSKFQDLSALFLALHVLDGKESSTKAFVQQLIPIVENSLYLSSNRRDLTRYCMGLLKLDGYDSGTHRLIELLAEKIRMVSIGCFRWYNIGFVMLVVAVFSNPNDANDSLASSIKTLVSALVSKALQLQDCEKEGYGLSLTAISRCLVGCKNLNIAVDPTSKQLMDTIDTAIKKYWNGITFDQLVDELEDITLKSPQYLHESLPEYCAAEWRNIFENCLDKVTRLPQLTSSESMDLRKRIEFFRATKTKPETFADQSIYVSNAFSDPWDSVEIGSSSMFSKSIFKPAIEQKETKSPSSDREDPDVMLMVKVWKDLIQRRNGQRHTDTTLQELTQRIESSSRMFDANDISIAYCLIQNIDAAGWSHWRRRFVDVLMHKITNSTAMFEAHHIIRCIAGLSNIQHYGEMKQALMSILMSKIPTTLTPSRMQFRDVAEYDMNVLPKAVVLKAMRGLQQSFHQPPKLKDALIRVFIQALENCPTVQLDTDGLWSASCLMAHATESKKDLVRLMTKKLIDTTYDPSKSRPIIDMCTALVSLDGKDSSSHRLVEVITSHVKNCSKPISGFGVCHVIDSFKSLDLSENSTQELIEALIEKIKVVPNIDLDVKAIRHCLDGLKSLIESRYTPHHTPAMAKLIDLALEVVIAGISLDSIHVKPWDETQTSHVIQKLWILKHDYISQADRLCAVMARKIEAMNLQFNDLDVCRVICGIAGIAMDSENAKQLARTVSVRATKSLPPIKSSEIDLFAKKIIQSLFELVKWDMHDQLGHDLVEHCARLAEIAALRGIKFYESDMVKYGLLAINHQYKSSTSTQRLVAALSVIVMNSVQSISYKDRPGNLHFLKFLCNVNAWGSNLDWTDDVTKKLLNGLIGIVNNLISHDLSGAEREMGEEAIAKIEAGMKLGRCQM